MPGHSYFFYEDYNHASSFFFSHSLLNHAHHSSLLGPLPGFVILFSHLLMRFVSSSRYMSKILFCYFHCCGSFMNFFAGPTHFFTRKFFHIVNPSFMRPALDPPISDFFIWLRTVSRAFSRFHVGGITGAA